MRRKNGSRCGKGDGDAAVSSHQRAYEAVERLLKETGRAAVVHPTGTGEPFVAFRLTEEHPWTPTEAGWANGFRTSARKVANEEE